jgi:hypothetical protein
MQILSEYEVLIKCLEKYKMVWHNVICIVNRWVGTFIAEMSISVFDGHSLRNHMHKENAYTRKMFSSHLPATRPLSKITGFQMSTEYLRNVCNHCVRW